ncbi:putative membrane protein [Xanthomonas euvesicatoria pv. vesicatoria str. 85-10]|uniref:Putative membrane protein n=2 Tax=Xanthomonas euvesicatoria TaxID=456327 RepID=Q3BRL4_XANE5|nr:putative membrane protein [Xanthomonas euvesicatoria pv. vesicatoria str. 85-10]
MLEGMLQLVAEVLLQALAELLIELGLHSVAESFERRPSPWLAAVGYAILGALLGGVSLCLLPQHLTATLRATGSAADRGSPPFSRTLTRRPIKAMRSVHVKAQEVHCRVQAWRG